MREELSVARSRGQIVEGERDINSKFASSGTFFKRLQAEAQEAIQGKTQEKPKKRQKTDAGVRSSSY